jgi:hypothetical protein
MSWVACVTRNASATGFQAGLEPTAFRVPWHGTAPPRGGARKQHVRFHPTGASVSLSRGAVRRSNSRPRTRRTSSPTRPGGFSRCCDSQGQGLRPWTPLGSADPRPQFARCPRFQASMTRISRSTILHSSSQSRSTSRQSPAAAARCKFSTYSSRGISDGSPALPYFPRV